ncbi:MAG: glycosyltransferase family 2 protein [Planctomycetota bacterium]|nr:glycosyltransferase family 2 protein [Planctomycetota bacterium]
MMPCDLIIPAYNEIENIDALFDELKPLRESGVVRHVVMADNGSTDGTGEAAQKYGAIVVQETRRGYGAACLAALAWIEQQGEPYPGVIAFLDADLSDDATALPDLLKPLESGEAQIVIGSRVKKAIPGALNFVQRFGNRLACTLMAIFSGRRYTDLGPFRALTYEALGRLNMADQTWGWTVEMQMKAALLDIPVVEVDVPYRKRRQGKSKISGTFKGVITAGSTIIITIFALWLQRGAIRAQANQHQGKLQPPHHE